MPQHKTRAGFHTNPAPPLISTPRKRGPHVIDEGSAELLRSSNVGDNTSTTTTTINNDNHKAHHRSVGSRTTPRSNSSNSSPQRIPLRRGWLRKTYTRLGRVVGWHERYFVCGNGAVQYFNKASNTSKPRGEVLLGRGCSVEFVGKIDEATLRYPFSVVFDDPRVPKLKMAADRLEDAEEWVKTIRSNIASALEMEEHNEEHTNTMDTMDTMDLISHPVSLKKSESGRLASYSIHSDDDDDTGQDDERFSSHSKPSFSSSPPSFSRSTNDLLLDDIPHEWQSLVQYVYNCRSPSKSWEMQSIHDNLRIFKDASSTHGHLTTEMSSNPLIASEIIQGISDSNVILQNILDVSNNRSQWDPNFESGHYTPRESTTSTFADQGKDNAIYRTNPRTSNICSSSMTAPRTYPIARYWKTFDDGSCIVVFDTTLSHDPKCRKGLKGNRKNVVGCMRGGYWIEPVYHPAAGGCNSTRSSRRTPSKEVIYGGDGSDNKNGSSIKSNERNRQQEILQCNSSIVTMTVQVNPKGWIGDDTIGGQLVDMSEWSSELFVSSLSGLKSILQHSNFIYPGYCKNNNNEQVIVMNKARGIRTKSSFTDDGGNTTNSGGGDKINSSSSGSSGRGGNNSDESKKNNGDSKEDNNSDGNNNNSDNNQGETKDFSGSTFTVTDEEMRDMSMIDYIHEADPTNENIKQCWSATHCETFQVRGNNYLEDRIKIASQSSCLQLVSVDLVQRQGPNFETPHGQICWQPWSFVQRLKKKYLDANQSEESAPFILCINHMIPGGMNVVMHFRVPSKNEMYGNSKAVNMLWEFMSDRVDDEYRDSKLKIIPNVVEGGWIVKRGVGNKPAIIGKKIDTSYHSGNGFFEIDVDIGSSKVAGAIMGLVKGYTKSLVIDLAYLLESHTTDELPEHVLGSTRFHRVDMEILKSYPHKEDEV